jgi:hypothetical protein
MIKLFICSWQRKHRRTIDIYEMIEELNQANGNHFHIDSNFLVD